MGQMPGRSQELSLGQRRERWAGDVRERVGELPHQAFPDPLLPSHSCEIPKHTLPHWTRHHPLLHGNRIQSGGMLVPKERGLRDTSKLSFCLSSSFGSRPCLPLVIPEIGKEGGRWQVGKGTASAADDVGEPGGKGRSAQAPAPTTPPAGSHRHPTAPTPRAARSASTGRATM